MDEQTGYKPFEVTNRVVLSIAVPMTLAYLTPLLGLVDTAPSASLRTLPTCRGQLLSSRASFEVRSPSA